MTYKEALEALYEAAVHPQIDNRNVAELVWAKGVLMDKLTEKYYIWVSECQDGLSRGAQGYKTMEDLWANFKQYIKDFGLYPSDSMIGYEIDLETGKCEPIEISNRCIEDTIYESLIEEEYEQPNR